MTSGFDELSLAVFTTLAPGGVVAFICMAFMIADPRVSLDEKTRLDRFLAIPIAVALIGFIASATHLGTPANALHVFSGIGRSPLSNEVLSAVAFLFLASSYWMMAFKENFSVTLSRIWVITAAVAGVGLIAMTSLAYSVTTVLTWDTPFTPANLILSALFVGPLLALFAKTCAASESRRLDKGLIIVACLALILGTVVLFLHEVTLANISNFETTAAELVPDYFVMICAHTLLGILSLVCARISISENATRQKTLTLQFIASVLAFVAIFITRFAFYLLHMTVGF